MVDGASPRRPVQIIDSHTAGEPTRVVIAGGPSLGDGDLQSRLEAFRSQHDSFRTAVLCEPRGSEVLVGALLCAPHDPAATAGVIFFNDVGYLGMCGHGSIGLVATLAYLGRLKAGTHQIETPVGMIAASLHSDGAVSITNVPSYRYRNGVEIDIPEWGLMHGDIAWGGNWFFLVADHRLTLHIQNRSALMAATTAVRHALDAGGIRGGRRLDRPHRVHRPSRRPHKFRPQLRPLPRCGLRSFAVRHGYQRKDGLSICRWQARSRRDLAPGRDTGHYL